MKEENIVIGQVCHWNTNRRAKRDRQPEYKEMRKLTIRQVWRGDKLAQVKTADGNTTTVKFQVLIKNYLAEKPDLRIYS